MPVISPYGNPQDCGPLQLPPLQTPVSCHPADAVTREINTRGAYVHVISRSTLSCLDGSLIRQQLRKLAERTIPTPATMVGVGFHGLYNHDHWNGASGLVFRPESASLISYKGSIGSYRLSHLPSLPVDDHAVQSQTLRQAFNQLDDTVSLLHPSRPKKLHLTEDVVMAAKKYDELAYRATVHHRPASSAGAALDDVSSKFIIARHVAQHKPAEQWSKADLLSALADAVQPRSERYPGLSRLLPHAQCKIEKFVDDAAIHTYLRKGVAAPQKVNQYKNLGAQNGVLPPNEHLLMPSMNDVLGVYVDLETVGGIDHAFDIMTELIRHQAPFARELYPAISYRLSQKKGHALAMLRWTKELRPWTTEALLDFAKTGAMRDGGKRSVPDHYSLILAVALHSALIGEQKEHQADGTVRARRFIDDLSAVSENGKNLLELLIDHRDDAASIEAARFFCLWQVPVQDASKPSSALTTARARHHPALALLEEMATLSPAEREAQRQSTIQHHLDKKLRRKPVNASYALRTGQTEAGKVAYIPQLQTCRVVEGRSFATDLPAPVTTGLRAYDPARAAMVQFAGSRRDTQGRTELGLWHVDPRDSNSTAAETLQLGVRFHTVHATAGVHIHQIDFVCTVPDDAVRIGLRVTDTRSGGEAVLVTMSAALGSDAINDGGCASFKMNHFVSRKEVAAFLERAKGKPLFHDLAFAFDAAHSTLSSAAAHAENHLRYRLAHRRFLQCWQTAISLAADSSEEVGKALTSAIDANEPGLLDALALQIEADHTSLREILLQSYDAICPTLARRDAQGACLLDHLLPLFRTSTSAHDAPLQCLLGATFASGCGDVKADHLLATELFKQAAQHALRGSYAGLGKLHEEGQAGLRVDIDLALEIYRQGAERGDGAALAALHALSLRLAAEGEAALAKVDALARGVQREQAAHLRDQQQAAAKQAALSIQLDGAKLLVARHVADKHTAETQLARTVEAGAAKDAVVRRELERERSHRRAAEASLVAVRMDAAMHIAVAHDATHRAEDGRRTAEEQLAATRLNSVRISGLARMRTWLRNTHGAGRR